MHNFSHILDALKAPVHAGFGGIMYERNVVSLLYLKNEKPRNPNTIKGLRFIPQGLTLFLKMGGLKHHCLYLGYLLFETPMFVLVPNAPFLKIALILNVMRIPDSRTNSLP